MGRYAKAITAAIGGIAMWVTTVFPSHQVAQVVAAVVALLTALGVYSVPNTPVAVADNTDPGYPPLS